MAFKKFNEFLTERKIHKKNKPSDKKALGNTGDKDLVYQPKVHKYEKNKNKGLADEGDEKNVYEPDTGPEMQKKAPEWHKTNIKEWLKKTNKLPLSEFAKKLYDEKNKVELNIGKINNSEDLINNFVKTLKENPKLIEAASREFNRSGLLESFFSELSKIKKSKKIHESISDPVGFEGKDQSGEDEEQPQDKMDDMSDEEEIDGEENENEENEDEDGEENEEGEDGEENEEGKKVVHHHHHHHHHHHGKDEDEENEEEDLDSDNLEDHGYSDDDEEMGQDMEEDSPLGRRSGGQEGFRRPDSFRNRP